MRKVIDASNWRAIDQAGFGVAIAAYLVDHIDCSIDSIQPNLLRFKLADSLRKAVRSVKLSKLLKRDLAMSSKHVKQGCTAVCARPNKCAGPHAEKMVCVLKDTFKCHYGRAQSQRALQRARREVRAIITAVRRLLVLSVSLLVAPQCAM